MKGFVCLVLFASLFLPCAALCGPPQEYNGHWYQIRYYPDELTWESAKTKANYYGGYLTCLNDASERDFWGSLVQTKHQKYDGYCCMVGPFIGGYRDGVWPDCSSQECWHWVNGQDWFYVGWSSRSMTAYEPTRMILHDGTLFSAVPASYTLRSFIVEWDQHPGYLPFPKIEFWPADEWDHSLEHKILVGTANRGVSTETSGGNPTEYLRMDDTLSVGSSITAFHYFTDWPYDPSVYGPIQSIDYSEDRIVLSALGPGEEIIGAFALIQGGTVYSCNQSMNFDNTSWQTGSLSDLTESDFAYFSGPVAMSGSGLDFSASGAPIYFGFLRGSENAGGSGVVHGHGIDNWEVVVDVLLDDDEVVPASSLPGRVLLAGLILLSALLLLYRRLRTMA